MDSSMTARATEDTSLASAMEPTRAIVEFPLQDDHSYTIDELTVHTLANVPIPDAQSWVDTHSVDDVRNMITRAERIQGEHRVRAEQAGQLADILRQQLRHASTVGLPEEPSTQTARIGSNN
jgi:hypothetical protein